MMNNAKIAVIVLNWNGWLDTIHCLESLYQSTYGNFTAFVVDNGSKDASVANINAWAKGDLKTEAKMSPYCRSNKPITVVEVNYPEASTPATTNSRPELLLIKNDKNHGFSKGNNIGIDYARKYCDPDFIMFLNNDTIIESTCLERLVETARFDEQAGACQPKMMSLFTPGTIDAVGISPGSLYAGAAQVGYGNKDTGQYQKTVEIFGACAGAALYRRATLDQIGLFDENFFAYYEDVDLALRSRLAGWKALLVPEGIVYHAHSATLGKDSPLKTFLLERNRYYYVVKCLPLKLVAKFLLSRPLFIFKKVFELAITGDVRQTAACVLGNMAALVNLPSMVAKRGSVRSMQRVADLIVEGWFKK